MAAETRLRFHLGPEGAVWYLRSSGANHVMVDPQAPARALAAGFVRPIELWRSPRWRHKGSVSVVRYADTEPSAPPAAERRLQAVGSEVRRYGAGPGEDGLGDVVSRAAVVDFVSDVSAFRLGALGALIDAVAAALQGGPPVVLAGGDDDEAALWIGAVSFFAPPAMCLQLSFSTHERLDDVLAQLTQEQARPPEPNAWRTPVLSVVPYADVDRLSKRDELPVVVVDPRVEATLGAVAGVEHRRTHLGQRITVTDWSRLALDACCEDFSLLERCLAEIDLVSVGGAADGRAGWWPEGDWEHSPQVAGPAWALAAAVAMTGDMRLALPTATRVLLRDTPDSVQLPSDLAANLTALVAATVDDAEQAWERLEAARRSRPVRAAMVQAAFESYLRLVTVDESWLLRATVPLPVTGLEPGDPVTPSAGVGITVERDPGLPGRLEDPLWHMVERLAGSPSSAGSTGGFEVREGVLVLRALDFAHRVIALAGGPDPARIGLGRLGRRAAEILLDAEVGERVAEVAGAIDAGVLARWVVPEVEHTADRWPGVNNPVGERLPAPVTALLARGVDADRLAGLTPEQLTSEPVGLEVAVAGAVGRIAGDPRFRLPALEFLLLRAALTYPDADPEALVKEVFDRLGDDEPWSAGALLRLAQRAPVALGSYLVPLALRHLSDWGNDPESGRLAAELLKRVEFLPRLGGDGRPRPRRAGTTAEEAQLLNLLAATGAGWLQLDNGLHRRAAEILMWADRAWPAVDARTRELIAPRITVAAFQVALAAEPAQAGTALRSRLGVVPVGTAWQAAVPIGLEPALPMLHEVLSLNRYRMAGELVEASTRSMLRPEAQNGQPDLPRLPRLPIGPVVRSLAAAEPSGALLDHLAILVDQQMQAYDGPVDERRLVAFWQAALPGATLHPARAMLSERGPAPGSAMAVAFGEPPPGTWAGIAQIFRGQRASPEPDLSAWETTGQRPGLHRAPRRGVLGRLAGGWRRWVGR
jgi:GTPase-associated protein 1